MEESLKLLKGCKNSQEWNAACDKIKQENGGYPSWWYEKVIQSGLMDETLGQGSSEIKIVSGENLFSKFKL